DFLHTPGYWHRVRQGKKIAGVCTGLAAQFENPILILPLRVFFIVTCLFYLFGLWFYLILWLLMPAPKDEAGKQYSPGVQTPPEKGGGAAPPVTHYPGQGQAETQPGSVPPPVVEAPAEVDTEPPVAQAEPAPAGPESSASQAEKTESSGEEKPAEKTGNAGEDELTEEDKWGPKSDKPAAGDEKKDLENF
ncbi:MAG: PspC domain-containing protein, partial [Gemmatimonadota bacterium]|nr:PspC domain-containing protein [Gemmatimonadota bacterium]